MGRKTHPSPPSAPTVLVVSARRSDGAARAGVDAAGDLLRPTHTLSLRAALAALTTGTFDCVLTEVDAVDVAAVEEIHALARRAGSAALVVVTGDAFPDDPAAATELDALTDLVLRPDDLAGDWMRRLHSAVERARLRSALVDAEASLTRLSGVLESVGDAVFTTTLDRVVTSWNRGAEDLFGYPAAEIVGASAGILQPPGSDEQRRVIEMVRGGQAVRGLETVRRTREGRLVEVSINVSPLSDPSGNVNGLAVVARDISDRRELEAELVRVTMHDVLTSLPNRAYLSYRLSQALADARHHNRPVAVLFVDLDQFKAVDDVYGHLVGDRVLARIADRLREVARPTDIVARVGGDEFVVMCPDTDVDTAGRLAEELIDAVSQPLAVERRAIRVGASVGIAVSPPIESDAESLLRHADAAMVEAKARGRARSQLFDPAFAHRAGELQRLAGDLRDALERHRLHVHYQPVVDIGTDRLVGVEALARWQHPTDGAVGPDTFVPLAEAHGFVTELDRWVLERACDETVAATRSGELPPGARVAVNLSARTLDDPDVVAMVDDVVRRTGLTASSLVLEVTETALLQNRDAARASLEGLRALGVGVFLDDFGTGYSSLSFLRELPVTGVKIDRSFVRDAVDRAEDLAITEAILRLGHGLGLETVAEGVETAEQRDLLRRLGCGAAQGYWWSRPVPMADIAGDRVAARLARIREAQPVRVEKPMRSVPSRWGRSPRRRTPEPALPLAPARTACCLRSGIEAGQAWLVVVGADRREAFARALGPLHAAAVARGQLVELDAYETLRRVTGADGRLDPARFEHVVGPALRRLGTLGTELGVHAELGHVGQPLLSLQVSTDLRHHLHAISRLTLEYGDHPADCRRHGPVVPVVVAPLAVDDSTAS